MSLYGLESEIEDLISSNAPDFEVSKLIKKSIKSYLQSLDILFESKQGKDFLVKHTKAIDMFLTTIYKYILRKSFGNYLPMSNAIPLTLVALGSYGREQMCVYSDIDLMIVYKDIDGYSMQPMIEKILYIAWDSGLKLGHRVHEVSELNKVAEDDITIKSSLIESRFIAGSKLLYSELNARLKQIRKNNQKEFVLEKIKEYTTRQDKFEFNMEPDIKEGIGGLRDANTLFWIANAKHGVKNLKELNEYYSLFCPEEYREFRISLEFLFRVRSALHLVANKKQDKMILQYIPDIAKKLGFEDKSTYSGQNALVFKTFEALKSIHLFCKVFIRKISREYIYDKNNIKEIRSSRVSKGVYLLGDNVFASYNLKPKSIDDILDVLLALPDRRLDFGGSFLYFIKRAIIEQKLNQNTQSKILKLFQRDYISDTIQLFFDANILHKLIRQFKKVLHLAQFDGYHQHPVTIHSIKSIYHLEHIKVDYIDSIHKALSHDDKTTLKIVVLLHDAGKGRRADHSIVGEKLYKVYAKKLGLNPTQIADGALLIKYHTLMSHVIHKEDIYNENTILAFTSKLKSKKLIDMLYILTYSDINGVGEDVYTHHTNDLLRELYMASIQAVEKEELVKESGRRVTKESSIKKDDSFISLPKIFQKKILSIPSNLLFLKYTKKDIINIAMMAKEVDRYEYKVLIKQHHLSIEIVRVDEINLGYLLGKLSFLNIKNFDIFRLFDEKKYFKIDFSDSIDEQDIPYIKSIIDDSFDMSKTIKIKKPTIDNVVVDKEHSTRLAKIVLSAKDQKGLFAYIAKLFDDYHIDIETAKISTRRNKAYDLFLVQKDRGFIENFDKFLDDIKE
jgi:[protein-PII] uridylyltransferase